MKSKYERYKAAVRRELRKHSEHKVILRVENFDELLHAKIVKERDYDIAHYTLMDMKPRVYPHNGYGYCFQTWMRNPKPIVIKP